MVKPVSPLAAVIALLKADPDAAALCAGRVFGEELPQSEAASMPRAAIVVKSYGGTGFANLPVHNPDFVIRSYGATIAEANQLHTAVDNVMRHFGRQAVETASTSTLLYSAILQSGPFMGRDTETYWHFYYSTWTVAADYRQGG